MALKSLLPALTARILDRAAAAAEAVEASLMALGPIRRTDSTLLAGDRVLNDDREILPRLSKTAGLGLCLYLGNRRIASASVPDAGSAPDPGGFADAILVDATLRRGELYRGTIDQQGRQVLVASRPVHANERGVDHSTLGIIEAFMDLGVFEGALMNAMDAEDLMDAGYSAHADGMGRITQFIDDVARRLQLLALNGNIIAAQAGEHGRAFRVVCRELSNLAEQSKDAGAVTRKLSEAMGLLDEEQMLRDAHGVGATSETLVADPEVEAAPPAENT